MKVDIGTQTTQIILIFADHRLIFFIFPSAFILILCVICVLRDDVQWKNGNL